MCLLYIFCYIYNFKSVFICVVNGICRTAAAPRQICHADGTVIDKVSVSFCHTTVVIFFGSIYRLIRKLLDTLVFSAVIFVPKSCLVGAGQNENQPYLRIFVFQSYHGLRRNGIKTESPARSEKIADRSVLFSSVYRGRPCARKYAERRKTVNE